MWKFLTRKTTAQQIVANSLEAHELELLKHQEAIEYHTRMAQYSEDNLRRLQEYKPLNFNTAKA